MFNNTLQQLERERKDKILNLKPEEVERYIDSLNKRMAAAYGNVANDFTPDVEASHKAADLCDEVIELLKSKYPNISSYTGWSRVSVLVGKLREISDDVYDMKLKRHLHILIMRYAIMGRGLIMLKVIMDLYYDFYTNRGRYDNIFYLIDKTALSQEDKRKVVNALDELPVYDFYNQLYMDSIERVVQLILTTLEKEYDNLKESINFTVDDETEDDEFFNKFRKDMLEYQQLSKDLLKEYEAYMDDGFHDAKESERKILSKMWNESHDEDRDYVEYIQYNRPSYDLKTMTFIPSQHDLDKMAAYDESQDME